MSFDPELCRNEGEVESKLIVQYSLPQLGYSSDTWHQEVAVGSIRLDFLAFAAHKLTSLAFLIFEIASIDPPYTSLKLPKKFDIRQSL